MFKVADKNDLCQVSLTGMRAIILLGLLIKSPRSLDEIREALIGLNILEEKNSTDILRIDMNTLKHAGCEISRASAKTNYKYVLENHPFLINVTDEEIKVLNRAYKKIKEKADIKKLIQYDDLLKKISTHICEDKKENFLGVSVLKYYNIELLKQLLLDCQNNTILNLEYRSPNSKVSRRREIICQKLAFRNDKVYIYGFDTYSKDSVMLHVQRILSILTRKDKSKDFVPNTTKVRFILNTTDTDILNEDEQAIDISENKLLVEGNYHNDFIAIQRILSFGSKCTVIEPDEFKNKIIQKLKGMKNIYERQ